MTIALLEATVLDAENTTDDLIAAFDEAEAREHTEKLRDCLEEFLLGLVVAFERGAWRALGYVRWDEYCKVELHGIRLSEDMVQTVARGLKARRWSNRAIGAGLGVSEFKIRTVTKGMKVEGKSRGADGKSYSAPPVREIPAQAPIPAIEAAPVAEMPKLPKTDLVVLDLLAAGPHGMVGPELEERYGWTHAIYSPTLSRLAKAGRVVRLAERRGRDAIYVHPEHVAGRVALAQRQRLALGRDERLALTAG